MFTPSIAFIGKSDHQMNILGKIVDQLHVQWQSFDDLFKPGIEKCDIIAIFHQPPLSDGFELLSQAKRKFANIPVLMVGVTVSQHDIVEAFRLGANDFIFLPIQPENLLNCLYRFLPGTSVRKDLPWWKKIIPSFIRNWLIPSPELVNHSIVAGMEMLQKQVVPSENAPDLQVQLLGSLSVTVNGKVLPRLPGKKAKTLLAYLLHKHPKPVHREVLIEQFWSESTPESARNCLNVTLHAIRKSFEEIAPGQEIIVYKNESYGLNPSLRIERDVDIFESYWKKGRQIEYELGIEAATDTYHQAFAFYRGDFLEDLPYEEWTERERDKYRETWLVVLDRLSLHFLEKGRYQVCMNLCRNILEKDPCLEDAHRRLMECYAQLGMKDMAVRQFLKCKETLKEELDISPGKVTAELYQKIREW